MLTLITDRLNEEWRLVSQQGVPSTWDTPHIDACASLGDAHDVIQKIRHENTAEADLILLSLLEIFNYQRDSLAGRLIFQIMLGRSISLTQQEFRHGSQSIFGDREQLNSIAVVALWMAIASYPIERRPHKVAVNICMDTLNNFMKALKDLEPAEETPSSQRLLTAHPIHASKYPHTAIELLHVLDWGISTHTITRRDAVLLEQVYCPTTIEAGGADSAARLLNISSATVRQRCSRATRRLASAVRQNPELSPALAT